MLTSIPQKVKVVSADFDWACMLSSSKCELLYYIYAINYLLWYDDSCKYLEVVGFVVVHVEGTEELGLSGDGYVFHIINAIYDGLTSELLHLDVVELSEVTEPLDQLWRDAAIELKTGKY